MKVWPQVIYGYVFPRKDGHKVIISCLKFTQSFEKYLLLNFESESFKTDLG